MDYKSLIRDLSNLAVIMLFSFLFLVASPLFFVFRFNYLIFTIGFFIPLLISLVEYAGLSLAGKKVSISNSVIIAQVIWIVVILASLISYVQAVSL